MNLNEILEQHKLWIDSKGTEGKLADLRGVDLRYTDLRYTDLPESTFIIMGEIYFISIVNGDCVRAGCQCHSIRDWRNFSKHEIAEMDSKTSLKFYPRLLDIIDFYCGKGDRPDWLGIGE